MKLLAQVVRETKRWIWVSNCFEQKSSFHHIHDGGFTMTSGSLYRLSAFSTCPQGGNPAGVWIGDTLPRHKSYAANGCRRWFLRDSFRSSRYRAGIAPFVTIVRRWRFDCGHATIATGVVLGEIEGDGTYRLATAIGEVPVTVQLIDGHREASLTSVEPKHTLAPDSLVRDVLSHSDGNQRIWMIRFQCQSLCRSVAPCIGRW